MIKTGLSAAETQILNKNQSIVNKKIKDSKVLGNGLKKANQFFKAMADRQKE